MHATIYVYPGSDSNRSLDASKSDARTATLNSVIRGAMTDTEQVFGVEYRDNLKQAVEYLAAVIESRFPHLPPWMDAYERIEQHRAKIDELTEQLATVEAEAAAMRALLMRWRGGIERSPLIQFNQEAELRLIDNATDTTAGRDMLAEMRRKDERIAELESRWKRSFKEEARQRSKCRTAKAALVEARERIAELERHVVEAEAAITELQATPPKEQEPKGTHKESLVRCNADGSPLTCEEIRQEQDGTKPVEWQYRTRGASVFRYNGSDFTVFSNGVGWVNPITYINWQACVDDPSTYPCDEHGERTTP
jgi:chromosome segregation ATPase